ncbi:hypothetical protein D922_00516 [Enterococcus faecalis 06-MB-DW-09]|nr:hypothetical protein D922_00516 [Enterococcus faecalis 06-MB-DW-09]
MIQAIHLLSSKNTQKQLNTIFSNVQNKNSSERPPCCFDLS